MSIAGQSENRGKECLHLERTMNALAYIPATVLGNEAINEIVEKDSSLAEECISLFQRSQSEVEDCLFPIFWGKTVSRTDTVDLLLSVHWRERRLVLIWKDTFNI